MSQLPSGISNNVPSWGQLYGMVQGFGQEQQQALQQNYQNAVGMAQQALAQSGLAGTSIAPSMRMGYMKQYQLALNNLNSQLTQTKLGVGAQGAAAMQQQSQFGQQQNLAQQGLNQQAQNQAYQQAMQTQQGGGGGDQGYNWQPTGDVANQMAGATLFS